MSLSLTTLKIWSFLTSSRRDLTECSWCAEEDGKSLPFTRDMNHLRKKTEEIGLITRPVAFLENGSSRTFLAD